jgi:hypothetical protein
MNVNSSSNPASGTNQMNVNSSSNPANQMNVAQGGANDAGAGGGCSVNYSNGASGHGRKVSNVTQ